MSRRAASARDELNPYVAITDTALNLVLVVVLVVAVLTAAVPVSRAAERRDLEREVQRRVDQRMALEDARYRASQRAFRRAVERLIEPSRQPTVNANKNDPPGTQRWVFDNRTLFEPGTVALTPGARGTLLSFAQALRENRDKWRRIRVEGHTAPTRQGQADRWEDATDRAASVARLLAGEGSIPAHFLATAGRGGQDPLARDGRVLPQGDPAHARVEIVLEYVNRAAGTPAGR